jgi:hemerythrin-like domain-containing protein
MCDHCGCRSIIPLGELMAEHERLLDLAGWVRRAVERGDDATARGLFALLVAVLEPHVAAEERGLFAVLRGDREAEALVGLLVAEHAVLHAQIAAAVDVGDEWADRVLVILDALRRHIQKEEFGLFPRALAALDVGQWELVAAVRETDLTS